MTHTTTRIAQAHQTKGRNLTTGSLHRAIWYLAPAIMLEMGVLNVAQVLDAYWVGYLGSAALAAVTISTTVRWVLNSMANGLGTGGMAVVARRIGARDEEATGHVAGQTILLGLGASLLLSSLGLAVARPLLLLLGADAEVPSLGLAYLRVALIGVLTLVLSFVINSMLRGAGEARWSMRVLILSTATTVLLEPVLIFGLGPLPSLGVVGSAWASLLGYGAGLMGFYGTYATAGYGVANRLLLIALIPCFGLGNAAGTLVGQNLGAGQPERSERSAWWVSAYAAGYMTVAAVLLTLLAPSLVSLFDPTSQVVAFGAECLRLVAWSEVASAVGVVLARSFGGAGNTVPAMAVNLISLWGLEVAVAFGLSRGLGWGVTGVWWGRTLANLANGFLLGLWFRRGNWRQFTLAQITTWITRATRTSWTARWKPG